MKTDEKGFILFEAMLSLILISIAVTFIIPSVIHIQELRSNTQDHREAVRLLDYEVRGGRDASFIHGSEGKYDLSEQVVDSGMKEVCIHWEGAGNRDFQWCLETMQ